MIHTQGMKKNPMIQSAFWIGTVSNYYGANTLEKYLTVVGKSRINMNDLLSQYIGSKAKVPCSFVTKIIHYYTPKKNIIIILLPKFCNDNYID